jgi:low affinity Fe/Cu permease
MEQPMKPQRGQETNAIVEAVDAKTNGDWFGRFSTSASYWLGSRWAFAGAGIIILLWAVSGPLYHYSDTWQLIINTGTSVGTFLMVFLIQNTQNRDARAINLKLNELIRALDKAGNHMIDIESLSDDELARMQEKYVAVREACLRRHGNATQPQ